MIDLHIKNLHLGQEEEGLVKEKIQKLTHLWSRLQDESVTIRVELDHDAVRAKEEAIFCAVTIFAPGKVKLHAEVHEYTVKNAIDKVESKLRKEIETQKGKKG